jgi:hypothetical protein
MFKLTLKKTNLVLFINSNFLLYELTASQLVTIATRDTGLQNTNTICNGYLSAKFCQLQMASSMNPPDSPL